MTPRSEAPKLVNGAGLVLGVLADHLTSPDPGPLTARDIAARLGVTERAVQLATSALLAAGVIDVTRVGRHNLWAIRDGWQPAARALASFIRSQAPADAADGEGSDE